jgi:class 3 adenylate cyclase
MKEPVQQTLIIAMADVAGFAKACWGRSDLEVFRMLDRFYGLVGTVIGQAGGTVVKFMGDCALLVFPQDKPDSAVAALRELRAKAEPLWSEFGASCAVTVKAHVGSAACGPIGPDGRFDVVGKSVNDLFLMNGTGAEEFSEALKRLLRG